MTTSTDDLVRQLRRSKRSSAVLVPLVEQFMKRPVEIKDKADRQFLNDLLLAQSQPRKAGVYSPSMLASCLRQVYLYKTGEKRHPVFRIESNGFFADGRWRHCKWQFVLWKMHRAGIIELVDVGSICIGTEVYVQNEKGDFGGTIDNIVYIPELDVISTVDWKGMNGNGFARALSRGPGIRYINQSVGYAGLANSYLSLPMKVKDVLIIGENKNGPINNRRIKSPLGLYEWRVPVADNQHVVAKRLKLLRAHERREEVPKPECVSTKRTMFKDCVFAPYCRGEVERIERKKFKAHRKHKVKFDQERRNGKS